MLSATEADDERVARPHSDAGERSVLGSLLIAPQAWEPVAELLEADDFHRDAHRLIYEGMLALTDRDEPVDAVALAEALNSQGQLDAVGGMRYLAELANNVPSASNAVPYARVVRTLGMQRRLIDAGQRIADIGFSPEGRDREQMLQDADEMLAAIADRRHLEGPELIGPAMRRMMDAMEAAYRDGTPDLGLHTGFSAVDEKIVALRPADLIVVAGRPSMGKTAFAMNIVEHNLLHRPAEDQKPMVVFSLEMPVDDLAMRMLAAVGKVDGARIRGLECDDLDWKKLGQAVDQLKDKPLLIDASAALSPVEMRNRLRQIVRQHGPLALVVVDYIQLMQVPGSENRTHEISEISRSLKTIAKQFRCPLIALSQLNRAVEHRTNKRPQMADLRESGAIEQDADIVMFIYRHSVYEPNADERDAEIIISKQRNGPTGQCMLAFTKQYLRFTKHDHSYDGYDDTGAPMPPPQRESASPGAEAPGGPMPFED